MTISRHLHQVLKDILELEEKFIGKPDGSTVPLEIFSSTRFYPDFKVKLFINKLAYNKI
jgi:hypothetical protein